MTDHGITLFDSVRWSGTLRSLRLLAVGRVSSRFVAFRCIPLHSRAARKSSGFMLLARALSGAHAQ